MAETGSSPPSKSKAPAPGSGAPAELGDLPTEELRKALHRVADRIADYLDRVGDYPVVPAVAPGRALGDLPLSPPQQGEELDAILDDYERFIEPAVTHWNHPGFLAYFAITGSAPGIVGEALAAALNVNGMLWRTAPAAVELEARVCDWVRQFVGLPEGFHGHINDTASTSTLVALGAARDGVRPDIKRRGIAGGEVPPLMVYASEQAHSSVDKAAMTLGLGVDGVRRIPTDEVFRMLPDELESAIAEDRASGKLPFAVVATAGTTSTTSVDPMDRIADVCMRERVWLHVDAAYGGPAAALAECEELFRGWERADSIVLNPHKWMFTPIDCSLLYVRDVEALQRAWSVVPAYLKTEETGVVNPMDLGFQMGRRFRALKLWMVLRAFGTNGIRERIREHCRLAREFAEWIDEDDHFRRVAPVPFSVVCFRATFPGSAERQDQLQRELLARVNAEGLVHLSGTELDGRFTLRVAVGNLRTGEEQLRTAWRLLRETAARLVAETDE